MRMQTTKKRPIRANEDVVVAPEATELLFEAEDVAELVAEVTGETVEVSAEGDSVTFAIGEDQYVVEAEGTEEFVESATSISRSKRPVGASTKRPLPGKGRTVKSFHPHSK